jgi:hypothetical protein
MWTGNKRFSIFPPLSPPGLPIVRKGGSGQSEYGGICFMMRRRGKDNRRRKNGNE